MRLSHIFKCIVAFLLCACLLVFAASCGESNPTPVEDLSNTETSEETSTQPKGNLNLLTGKHDLPDQAVGKRPVSFMINNIRVALPQYGIGQADVIFEALAEGGITRLMAIFSDYQNLPEQVGPIRSARDYYLDFAAPVDTIFVNWGTSSIAAKAIKARGTDNLDGMYYSNYFYTDQALAQQKGWEHSRFMKPEGFLKALERKEERTESENKETIFAFRDEENTFVPADQAVTHLQVHYSYSYDATFDYDEASGKYLVSEFGDPHMDNVTKTQLAFDNVIVIYTSVVRINNKDGKVAVGLESGDGVYVSKGGGMTMKWTKNNEADYHNHFSFTDKSGAELAINPGTTYVCVIPLEQQGNTVAEGPATQTSSVEQG